MLLLGVYENEAHIPVVSAATPAVTLWLVVTCLPSAPASVCAIVYIFLRRDRKPLQDDTSSSALTAGMPDQTRGDLLVEASPVCSLSRRRVRHGVVHRVSDRAVADGRANCVLRARSALLQDKDHSSAIRFVKPKGGGHSRVNRASTDHRVPIVIQFAGTSDKLACTGYRRRVAGRSGNLLMLRLCPSQRRAPVRLALSHSGSLRG